MAREIDGTLCTRVLRTVSSPVGVAHLEDPAVLDHLARVNSDANPFVPATAGGGAVALVAVAGRHAQAVGAAVIVAAFSIPAGAILFVAVMASRGLVRRWNIGRARAFNAHMPRYRLAAYTSALATAAPAAKETRVFGLLDWLLARHQRQWDRVTTSMSAQRKMVARRTIGLQILLLPIVTGVIVVVGRAAADGQIGAGRVTAVLGACVTLTTLAVYTGDDQDVVFGLEAMPALRALQVATGDRPPSAPVEEGIDAADMPGAAIRFKGVAFAYPGADREVFSALDLEIPAGASLAIVGVNGAGKTTLVKLLARLYEPTAGRITVDGVDIRELDLVSWRRRLAVIFQDFTRYHLTATDNVAFGALSHRDDGSALRRDALQASALDTIERLPGGWQTVLSRQYSGGAELSGGEWQRVALARALFALDGGAGVLALDEPTANLDVRAEAELFDHFLDMTAGATTILISHRFSTVRHADRICAPDTGRVTECGSHSDLLAGGSGYATMFRLQAARFDA